MVSLDLALPLPLMILWMFLILLAESCGKVSLILSTSLMLFPGFNTWAYGLPLFLDIFSNLFVLFQLEEVISLKNFEISFTSLSIFFKCFSQDRRGQSFNAHWFILTFFPFLPVLDWVDVRGKFESYFLSK